MSVAVQRHPVVFCQLIWVSVCVRVCLCLLVRVNFLKYLFFAQVTYRTFKAVKFLRAPAEIFMIWFRLSKLQNNKENKEKLK